mgnify:CR=1 FL=1
MNFHNISNKALILISLLIISTSLTAQPSKVNRQGPPQRPNETQIANMVEELASTLELSNTQKHEISTLYYQHFEEIREVMAQNKSSRPPSRTVMDAKRTNFESQVKAMLNKEQVQDFEKFLKSHGPRSQQSKPRR